MFKSSNSQYALKASLVVVSWIPVIMTFNEHVCYVAKIEGSSMRPTLNPDQVSPTDWVLLWKFGAKNINNLKKNDVVLFKSPINPKKVYCKRIKGMQHDSIRSRHPYPKEIVHIPRNHIWVEGDNVYHSIDSNNFGPISTGLVLGKATRVIWPPSRWGTDLHGSEGRGEVKFGKSTSSE